MLYKMPLKAEVNSFFRDSCPWESTVSDEEGIASNALWISINSLNIFVISFNLDNISFCTARWFQAFDFSSLSSYSLLFLTEPIWIRPLLLDFSMVGVGGALLGRGGSASGFSSVHRDWVASIWHVVGVSGTWDQLPLDWTVTSRMSSEMCFNNNVKESVFLCKVENNKNIVFIHVQWFWMNYILAQIATSSHPCFLFVAVTIPRSCSNNSLLFPFTPSHIYFLLTIAFLSCLSIMTMQGVSSYSNNACMYR